MTVSTYVCSYTVDGRHFEVHVCAANADDAARHLQAIGSSGQVDGELVELALSRAKKALGALRKGLDNAGTGS